VGGGCEGYTSAGKASILGNMKLLPISMSQWWAKQAPNRRLAIWTCFSLFALWVLDKAATLAFEVWLTSRGADRALILAEGWLAPLLLNTAGIFSNVINDRLIVGIAIGALLFALLPTISSLARDLPRHIRRMIDIARFGTAGRRDIRLARQWISLGNEIQQFLTDENAFNYGGIGTRPDETFEQSTQRLLSATQSLKDKYRSRFSGRVEAARQEIARRGVPNRGALVMPGDDVNPLCMQDAAEKIAAAGHRLLSKYGVSP
jgi:hypothetical protein